jgi:hypothetical protein
MADPAADATATDPRKRALGWAIWLGVALGLLVGIPRYGVFSMLTVAMGGLGVIVTVGTYAAWVAIRPAKEPPTA